MDVDCRGISKSHMSSRLDLTDSIVSMIVKMAEGNPGAATAMSAMVEKGYGIDPQAWGGGISAVFCLDSWGIYGHRIWMLYKDVCGQNVEKTLAVIRACQLGLLGVSALNHAIDNRGDGIDVADLMMLVKGHLPEFGVKEEPKC